MTNRFSSMVEGQATEWLFKEYCPELLKTRLEDLPEIAERNALAESIVEDFYSEFGKMPESRVLQQLSDYLLLDHIKNPDQTKKDKLPIITDRQLGTRRKKETAMSENNMDHFNARQQFNIAIKRNTQEKELD